MDKIQHRLSTWLNDTCELNDAYKITPKNAYNSYSLYCDKININKTFNINNKLRPSDFKKHMLKTYKIRKISVDYYIGFSERSSIKPTDIPILDDTIMLDWMKSDCELCEDYKITPKNAYISYSSYCDKNQTNKLRPSDFKKHMLKTYKIKKINVNYYIGFDIKNDEDNLLLE